MAKKLSELQKKEIKELFSKGNSIIELANLFKFSTQTITRQLKIMFDQNEFKILKKKDFKSNKK